MNLWNTKRTAKTKWQRAGFTLLELLVVISIIGILTAIGFTAFSVAQKKGRDGRRVGDMKSVQAAFEQYYAANGSNYPTTGGGCPSGNITIETGTTFTFPSDPKPGMSYVCPTLTASSYCICADVEDNKGNSSNASCSFVSTATGTHFCVKNLQ